MLIILILLVIIILLCQKKRISAGHYAIGEFYVGSNKIIHGDYPEYEQLLGDAQNCAKTILNSRNKQFGISDINIFNECKKITKGTSHHNIREMFIGIEKIWAGPGIIVIGEKHKSLQEILGNGPVILPYFIHEYFNRLDRLNRPVHLFIELSPSAVGRYASSFNINAINYSMRNYKNIKIVFTDIRETPLIEKNHLLDKINDVLFKPETTDLPNHYKVANTTLMKLETGEREKIQSFIQNRKFANYMEFTAFICDIYTIANMLLLKPERAVCFHGIAHSRVIAEFFNINKCFTANEKKALFIPRGVLFFES